MKLKSSSVENIKKDLGNLNLFNSTPGIGTTRVFLTEEELKARAYIKERMRKLGLKVREDAAGNIFGKLEGTDSSLSPVWTGSHIDTVLNAGNFDGMVGVIGGLETIRLIKESGLSHRRNIEVVVFASEEPTRFGKGCLGSRTMAGKLSLEEAKSLKDTEGKSYAAVLESLGHDLNQFSSIRVPQGSVHSFIELHIEQGVVLEQLGLPIGVVTKISAPTDIHVTVLGKQGHAGATPMNMRYDALMAASEIFLKLETLTKESDSPNTVGTVGKIKVSPNASNVIPGEVFFTIDIRGSEFKAKDDLVNKLVKFIKEVGERREVAILTNFVNHDIPIHSDPDILAVIKDVCRKKELFYKEMVSGAVHDSMFVAEFAPMGMIFVPCKDGISHTPQEWTDYDQIAKGVDILAGSIIQLANS